jgi:hypothetical protein
MADITELTKLPTQLAKSDLDASAVGYHESLFRSYHVLNAVKGWLKRGLPSQVILDYIALIESSDGRK